MSKTILTVDDSPSVRQMVSFTLRRCGYAILEAGDGVQALTVTEAHAVHLIITDLNMPNMDGIELIRRLRAQEATRFVPIVMLTTESQPEKKSLGKSAGATGWIVKPFTPEQLTAVVQKLLR